MSDTTPSLWHGDSGSRFIPGEELAALPRHVLDDLEGTLAKMARRYAETHPGFQLTIEENLAMDGVTVHWRMKKTLPIDEG